MLRRTRLALALPVSLSLVAGLAGCGDPDEPAKMTVPYQLGNNLDCDDVGVSQIVGTLDGDVYEERVDCGEDLVFESVSAGRYTLVVEAETQDGLVVLDNGATPASDRTFEVLGTGTEVTVERQTLTDSPVELQVRWDFDFTSCNGTGIDAFKVTAFDDAGTGILLTEELACDANGYQTVEDEGRELGGNIFGQVSIEPIDSGNEPIGEPVSFAFEPPGAGRIIRLSMVCDDVGCTGTGMPDEN